MFQKISLAFIVMWLLTGCQQSSSEEEHHQSAEQTAIKTTSQKNQQQQLANLIENKGCDQNEQCKIVGLGARPCGGFERYEVYSTQHANQKLVETLANNITQQQKQQNKESGMVSICQHVSEPNAICKAKLCQISNKM